jgi:hypothetical protein
VTAKSTTQSTTAPTAPTLTLAPLAKPERDCQCRWTVRLPGRADLTGRPKAHRDAAEYDAETDHTHVALDCDRTTQSVFAPGHDARLKGLAQTAVLLGGELVRTDGLAATPEDVLAALAPNLLDFLPTDEQVETHREAAAKRAAKATKPEAEATEAESA